jgi:hypothetical protein
MIVNILSMDLVTITTLLLFLFAAVIELTEPLYPVFQVSIGWSLAEIVKFSLKLLGIPMSVSLYTYIASPYSKAAESQYVIHASA